MRVAVEVKQIKNYADAALIATRYYLYKFIVYLCYSNHLWPNDIKVQDQTSFQCNVLEQPLQEFQPWAVHLEDRLQQCNNL